MDVASDDFESLLAVLLHGDIVFASLDDEGLRGADTPDTVSSGQDELLMNDCATAEVGDTINVAALL